MHLIVDEFLGKNVPHKVQQCVPGQEPDPKPQWKNEVQVMFFGGISIIGGKTPLYHFPFKPKTTPENDMRLKKNRDDPKKKAAHQKAQEEMFDTLKEDRCWN